MSPARKQGPAAGAGFRRLATWVLCCAATGASGQPHPSPLDGLAWLGGCWRSEGAETGSGEQWTPLAGGTLLGVGRTVRAGATVAHEFMQIRQADGKVLYVAHPAGQIEVAFVLVRGSGSSGPVTEAVFENPEHDFPQRVSYRLEAGGRLRTRIEGQRGGLPQAVDGVLSRTACDAQPASPEAFQGLPWGASEAQLALRFGPQLERATCSAPTPRNPARPGEACDHPVVANYPVASVPFRLNLHVDAATRQLVRVTLAHALTVNHGAPDSAWGERHRLLRQLLSQRYGSPEATHVTAENGAPTASARWRRGDTLIELQSAFAPTAAGNAAQERLEIVYQPVTAGDAGKL